MKKKLVSSLLCAVMAASLLAGCGKDGGKQPGQGSSGKADVDAEASGNANVDEEGTGKDAQSSMWLLEGQDTAELSLGIKVGATDKEPDDMWFFKYYEEMTGVHMNVTAVLTQDWEDKKNIMMASGEYPGIIFSGGFTTDEISKYGREGVFLDLKDYIQYMPNYQKEMDKIDGWKNVTCPDGGIYSLAYVDPMRINSVSQLFINHDWLEKAGLEVPETLEDFYQALKAFKENDMDGDGNAENEIPYSAFYATDTNDIRVPMLNAFGFDTDGTNIGLESWNNNEVVYIPLTERYKEYLVYMKKLMDEGLIDQDTFSQSSTQLMAKTTEGICGVFNLNLSQGDPDRYESYSACRPKYDENSEKIIFQGSPVSAGSIVITDNCEDPILAAKWIDLFYAPENCVNLQAGPVILEYPDGTLLSCTEGIEEDPEVGCHYRVDEEGKYLELTFPGATEELDAWNWLCLDHPANGMFWTTLGEYYMYGQLLDGFPSNIDEELIVERERYENVDGEITNRMAGYGRAMDIEVSSDYWTYGYPTVYPSEEQQEWIYEHQTILDNYVLQMEAKFITGAADLDTEYDAFIAELKNMGAEEYQKIYSDLYNN